MNIEEALAKLREYIEFKAYWGNDEYSGQALAALYIIREEVEKRDAIIGDLPDHSDLDAAAFQVNALRAQLERYETALREAANDADLLRKSLRIALSDGQVKHHAAALSTPPSPEEE